MFSSRIRLLRHRLVLQSRVIRAIGNILCDLTRPGINCMTSRSTGKHCDLSTVIASFTVTVFQHCVPCLMLTNDRHYVSLRGTSVNRVIAVFLKLNMTSNLNLWRIHRPTKRKRYDKSIVMESSNCKFCSCGALLICDWMIVLLDTAILVIKPRIHVNQLS